MIDDWFWEYLTKQPYPYHYCSCYDESTIEKWARKKRMDNLKEMVDTMSETKYVKNEGIELNEENLPEICRELIGYNYVFNLEVDKVNKVLKVIPKEGCNRSFKFGEYLQMNKYSLRATPTSGKEYTACWLYNTLEWMEKLYVDNNVGSFTVAQDPDGLMLTVDGETCSIKYGVIVFDENNHFVECFDDNENIGLTPAMEEHGYKKVKKNE